MSSVRAWPHTHGAVPIPRNLPPTLLARRVIAYSNTIQHFCQRSNHEGDYTGLRAGLDLVWHAFADTLDTDR